MKPILFEIPYGSGFPVFGFICMMVIGFGASLLYAVKRAKKRLVPTSCIIDCGLLVVATGFIGARLFYLYFENASGEHTQLFDFGDGDLSIWGGLLLAVPAALIYCRIRKVSFRPLADIIAPPLAVGLFLGKIGCFLAGCCWGRPTPAQSPWGMMFPEESEAMTSQWLTYVDSPELWENLMIRLGYPIDASPSIPVYATQVFEAAGLLLLLVVVLVAERRRFHALDGRLFAAFMLLYPAGYFLVGFLRDDTNLILRLGSYSGLHLGQVIAMAICLVAAVFFARGGSRTSPEEV